MSKYVGAQMLEFSQNGDERGHLVVVEGNKDIPLTLQESFIYMVRIQM